MAGIVYDARRVKVYEGLLALGALAGEPQEWCDALWADILSAPDLFEELVFYLEHHYLTEKVKCCGYSLIDLYVWQMNRYNLIGDSGKNTDACNKDRMVLKAFRDMVEMRRHPEEYLKKLTLGREMDQ
ncbi:MAG: hypothetical protein NC337_06125 [Roseburia sp.]|nr:hypothetical protein [Roseburia sp.]